jgi:hypothetical protein
MSKKWMAISVLLFAITALLGWQLYKSIIQFNADNDPTRIQPVQDVKQIIAQEKVLAPLAPAKNYIPAEFAVIPENNVFSESRSPEEETTEDAVQPEAPALTQKPILVGVNISDNQKTVLLIDPRGSSRERSDRAQIKRIGDVFHGYTIAEIAQDHIVLESGSKREIIPLHEGSKQAQRGKTPILSTRVVSFSGGTVSGGSLVASSARNAGAPQTKVAPVAAPADQAVSSPSPPETVSQQGLRSSIRSSQPPQRTTQQVRGQQAPGTGSTAPNTRVIRTPFGNIVRPVGD